MRLGVREVQGIDDHADVGRVLARDTHVRDLDQLKVTLVKDLRVGAVARPIAVGLAKDHIAAIEQTPEHQVDVEFLELRVPGP